MIPIWKTIADLIAWHKSEATHQGESKCGDYTTAEVIGDRQPGAAHACGTAATIKYGCRSVWFK